MIRALAYVPVEELEGRPHVVVDGAARPETVLALSHWPQSPTPAVLARDLSAQIVFAYLHASRGGDVLAVAGRSRGGRRRSDLELKAALAAGGRAEAVTNDHFDEDGLVSIFAMAEPELALRHEDLLVEVASCGDFGVVHSRQAARVAFAIGPMAEGSAGPAPPDAERPGSWSGSRYLAVLSRTAELLEHTDRFRRYWEEPDAALSATLGDIGAGRVRIEEVTEVDLAVVTRTAAGAPLDEVALHSATPVSRMVVFDDGRCELHLRYEGWVRYVSRSVPLRPDLAPLAAQLSAVEPSGIAWQADGIGSLVTRMAPGNDGWTDLDPTVVLRTVVEYLKRAPAAWDPFRRGGALVPMSERAQS